MINGNFPDQVPMIARPTDKTSANPFSFGLSWPLLDCVLKENVAVLLSDGAYNHFTMLWGRDRRFERYATIDANPDDFFLADGRNLLGIRAERKRIKRGTILHWLGNADFREVFRESVHLASSKTFTALYEAAPSDHEKVELAYAAFLAFAVYGDDSNINISLLMAQKVIEKFEALEETRKSRFPHELRMTLAMVNLMNSRPNSYDMLPKEVGRSDVAFVLSKIFNGPLQFDRELIAALRAQLISMGQEAIVDKDLIAADIGPGKVERLLLYRYLKTSVLYSATERAADLLASAGGWYPDEPRIVLYSSILKLKTEASDTLPYLESAVSQVERTMLQAAKVQSLDAFRQAIHEYHVETDDSAVAFVAWQALLVIARKSAEDRGLKLMAARFAEKELFTPYAEDTSKYSFCKEAAIRYARREGSPALVAAALKIRAADWFGVACRRKGRT